MYEVGHGNAPAKWRSRNYRPLSLNSQHDHSAQFVAGRGLLQSFEAKDMLGYKHSGFSADTSVRTKAHDRAGLGRLLRYFARPPFACGAAAQSGQCAGVALLPKQHSEPGGDKRAGQRGVNNPGAKADELTLTPLEPIDRIAALVPPPRTHRQIRDHIGVQSEPPRLSPAREPPMWEECDALMGEKTGEKTGEGTQVEPNWDTVGQPAPDFEVDSQVNW